jgi:sulfoxide reductase heme-binding subunit YedZ
VKSRNPPIFLAARESVVTANPCCNSLNSRNSLNSSFVSRFLANKLAALTILIGIGVWFLVVPVFTDQLGANPVERLLHVSGEIAIWMLGSVLSLSPLRVLFPRSAIVNALNRHRRYIGVSACIYGLIHLSCHVLYEGDWDDLLQSFSKPFTWFGLIGLTILVLLAATSNNWSVHRLGGKRWKLLHRLAYVAAAVLIYHQTIAGKGHWYISRWLLVWLLILQTARLTKYWATRTAKTREPQQSPERSR